jgi:hypothetical protein
LGGLSPPPRAQAGTFEPSDHRIEQQIVEEEYMASYEGYCVKCREKRQFDGEEVEMANGRRSAKGKCPVCGTGMNRILGKKA